MPSYLALLGNHRALSIAELAATLPDFTPKGDRTSQTLLFETDEELNQEFLDYLGGTILLAKNIGGSKALTLNDLPSILTTELKEVKGKAAFGLRYFGVDLRKAHDLYKQCKKHLKSKNVSSRYIGSEREPAKPIQLHDSGLLDPKRGTELVILKQERGLWIGRTIAAQNVKKYTLRDIEKPVRDTTVGLLPPKLAQILLNFGEYLIGEKTARDASSGKKEKLTVFDPFSGTGVIPLEAMLRGHNVLASDISEKAVSGTKKNIEWMRKTFDVFKKDIETTVWKQDARKPFMLTGSSSSSRGSQPNVIVTEGTLGPPIKNRPTLREVEKFSKAADLLVVAFLANCTATLPGVPIVMTLPVWYTQKRMVWTVKVFDAATSLGYRVVLPPHTDPSAPPRMSLLYRRPDQFVGREIVLLKPSGR